LHPLKSRDLCGFSVAIHSQKQRIEKNNKDLIENPKFFYHRLFGAQNITKGIIDDNNIIQTNPEICIKLMHKWWSKLFSQPTKKKKKIPKILQEYFKKIQILSPIEDLNAITIEEYKQRLGKRFVAPEQSGLSSELINLYPPELMQFFVDLRNKIVMEAQPIPNTWRYNPITLLPKNLKQFKQPHEFRPITLLDNQYRGLSHDIWLRLKKHVKNNNIISRFQSGIPS
jgi:hypothetical protein